MERARQSVAAARARIPQAGALPDPMVMYGVMNQGRPVPFESLGEKDFSEAYVGVSQEVPLPGKRKGREAVARQELAAEEWAFEATGRRVGAEVTRLYHELAATTIEDRVVAEHARLLDELTQATAARLGVGPVSSAHVRGKRTSSMTPCGETEA